jgi:uncharacterized membrane-anchored protein YhcB (DUF1043 family)
VDATTLGGLIAAGAALVGSVVAYLGKRGENALSGYSHLTGDLQEERDRLDRRVTELNAHIAEMAALRAADQAELARLRALVIHLGGSP